MEAGEWHDLKCFRENFDDKLDTDPADWENYTPEEKVERLRRASGYYKRLGLKLPDMDGLNSDEALSKYRTDLRKQCSERYGWRRELLFLKGRFTP